MPVSTSEYAMRVHEIVAEMPRLFYVSKMLKLKILCTHWKMSEKPKAASRANHLEGLNICFANNVWIDSPILPYQCK